MGRKWFHWSGLHSRAKQLKARATEGRVEPGDAAYCEDDAMNRAPDSPLAASPSVLDSRAFRDVLGAYATGVTIISIAADARAKAETDAGGLGITVNSFTSVSLDPPLVLWCLGADSARYQAFHDANQFTVSILGADHEALARRFAAEAVIPAEDAAFEPGPNGAPWLRAAVARLACRTTARHAGGDHVILVGEVTAADGPHDAPALGFRRGLFTALD